MPKFVNVYKHKKVLVTGHTGFKGSWLCVLLKELKANVIGYALKPNTRPNLFDAIGLEGHIDSVIGDIRDRKKLSDILGKYKPEFVFHLAAQPLVRLSYHDPELTYQTNCLGTVNILEAIRHNPGVKVFVNVTTDKCYQNIEKYYRYKETDPLGGHDPYSSSKACAELITAAYRNSYFSLPANKRAYVAVSTARAGNIIGGGDWNQDRLIPDCIKALVQNKPFIIRNPRAIRPWQYVVEPLYGYVLLASLMARYPYKFDGAWNFGPSGRRYYNVLDIAKKVVADWGSGSFNVKSAGDCHEAGLLILDSSKSSRSLNWKPKYNLDESIQRTIAWYKKFYDHTNKSELFKATQEEIRSYFKK